jgi:hypothetical protein
MIGPMQRSKICARFLGEWRCLPGAVANLKEFNGQAGLLRSKSGETNV